MFWVLGLGQEDSVDSSTSEFVETLPRYSFETE